MEKEEYQIKVGSLIREARKERNMSIEELAFDTGISFNTISLMERGKSGLQAYSLYKIARCLRIDLNSVFCLGLESKDVKELNDFKDKELCDLLAKMSDLTKILKKFC